MRWSHVGLGCVIFLMAVSCRIRSKDSSLDDVEFSGSRHSCQQFEYLWAKNLPLFVPGYLQAAQCMDRLREALADTLSPIDLADPRFNPGLFPGMNPGQGGFEPGRGAVQLPGTGMSQMRLVEIEPLEKSLFEQRQECIAEVEAMAAEDKPHLLQSLGAITKCLGAKDDEERKLLAWLIADNRIIRTEDFLTRLFFFPLLPAIGRGDVVFSPMLPEKDDPNYQAVFEVFSQCANNADASLNTYMRLTDVAKGWDLEGCGPFKEKDRTAKAVAFHMCSSPCKYSQIPCHICEIKDGRYYHQTCTTERGAKAALEGWCNDTFSADCGSAVCRPTTEKDISYSNHDGSSQCMSWYEADSFEFSQRIGGTFRMQLGSELTMASGSSSTKVVRSGVVQGTLKSSFNLCSTGHSLWIEREDGRREANYSSYFTCTVNFDTMRIDSTELEHQVEAKLVIGSPIAKAENAAHGGISQTTKGFEGMTVAATSELKPAGGASATMMRETCKRWTENWKTNSLQNFIDHNLDARWVGRYVGGVSAGFCTADSDCFSTLYGNSRLDRGKVFRCIDSKCQLRSTGRFDSQNRWCGNRCNLGIFDKYNEPCDTKGGFSCKKTNVPYSGWHWIWQDPNELSEEVWQCVPESVAANRADYRKVYGDRELCERLPGVQ